MTPEEIAAASKCYSCMDDTQKQAAIVYLLEQLRQQEAADGTVTSFSFTDANGIAGVVTNPTTTPNLTISLGAITPISAAFTGVGGAGFISLLSQASDPSAPVTSGFKVYADSTGRFSWRRASDGFTRTWDATLTANRVYTLKDATGTIPMLEVANTWSANGALSAPAASFTGTPIVGGSATTTKPMVLIETSGATSNAWSTNGTMLALNPAAGFSGDIFSVNNNGSQYFSITGGGQAKMGSGIYLAWSTDLFLSRKGAANLQLGQADIAAPVAQTLSVQSVVAGTTDTAGVNVTYDASRGTGTGVGGSHVFRVAPAGSTGSSQNSLVRAFSISPNVGIQIGSGGGGISPAVWPFSASTHQTMALGGYGLTLWSYAVASGETGIAISGTSAATTSGTLTHANVIRSFAPTSGTAVYNHFVVQPTINQTGGANGITRGIYVNPTLTAAADFRAIEVSAGVVQIASSLTTATATGTDAAGNNLTVIPGVGTGTGRAGDLIAKTGLTTTTGSTAQTASTREYASAKFVDLTESTATTLFTITVGTAAYTGFTCVVTTFATDGTDHQAITSTLTVSAVNKAGTITATIAEAAGTTAASAGTLTAAFTVVDNGSGVLAFKDNAVSSLTQTVLRAKWFITALNSNDAATVTPV